MNLINKINIRLAKAKTKVINNIKLVYKALQVCVNYKMRYIVMTHG